MNTSNGGPSVFDYLKTWPQYLIPHHTLSRLMHHITRSSNILWRSWFTRWFVKQYRVDMSQAQEARLSAYPNFNAFFTRALRAEARPIIAGETSIACPVDGTISQLGDIHEGRIFQAKGRDYSLDTLLGGDKAWAKQFENGRFATLYLSPRDYHRIHMPMEGQLQAMTHVPGRLFSVNAATTRTVPGLFARNERVIAYFETDAGPMALVLVGAIFVASIETVWAGEVTPPAGRHVQHWQYQGQDSITLAKGMEMGRFNMGSTVIVLFGPGKICWDDALAEDQSVTMGQGLGQRL
jgi:phosphatidylserine decarboxylase